MSDITNKATEYTEKKAAAKAAIPQGFSHDELLQALYWIWDVFERSSVPLILLGTTARLVADNDVLQGTHITTGVRKLEWISGGRRLIDAFAGAQFVKEDETKAEYVSNGVPVIVYLLDDAPEVTNPNTTLYQSEYFCLPNPLAEKYLANYV